MRIFIVLFTGFWLTLSLAQDIQTDAGRAQERKRIELAKQVAEQQFELEDKDCRARFVVTSCQEAAKLKRLRTLDLLKRDESVLDTMTRREAAIEQQKRVDENSSYRALAEKAAKQDEAKANSAVKAKERADKARERAEKDKAAARVKSPSSHTTATSQELEAKRSAYLQKQQEAADRVKRRDDNVREAKRKADERAADKLKNP